MSSCRFIVTLKQGEKVDLPGKSNYRIDMDEVNLNTAYVYLQSEDIGDEADADLKLGQLVTIGDGDPGQIILLSTKPIENNQFEAKMCIISEK